MDTTSRRQFLTLSTQCAFGAVALTLLPGESRSQLFGVPIPVIFTALRSFASNVMTEFAAQSLNDWLSKALFPPAPPPPPRSSPLHFHATFNPKVIVNVPSQPRFASPTKIRPAASLIVEHRPKLVRSSRIIAPANHELNERELVGISNTDNDCIYNGTYFDLPVDFDYRQGPTMQDHLTFRGLVADNKIADAVDYENPRLDYVRQFCTCRGRILKGFGYRSGQDGEFEGFYPYGPSLTV